MIEIKVLQAYRGDCIWVRCLEESENINIIIDSGTATFKNEFKNLVDKVDIIEENIDKTNREFNINQLIRLKQKKCTTENSVVYTKILTDFERIGDHGLNIAESFYKIRKAVAAMKMKPEMIEE
mgnify:CR=1 FL=1